MALRSSDGLGNQMAIRPGTDQSRQSHKMHASPRHPEEIGSFSASPLLGPRGPFQRGELRLVQR